MFTGFFPKSGNKMQATFRLLYWFLCKWQVGTGSIYEPQNPAMRGRTPNGPKHQRPWRGNIYEKSSKDFIGDQILPKYIITKIVWTFEAYKDKIFIFVIVTKYLASGNTDKSWHIALNYIWKILKNIREEWYRVKKMQ